MQKYKRVKKVSQGAFGTVYEFQNLSPSQKIPDPTVAIKQLYSSSANVKRELQILQDLPQHQNLLKIFEIINDKFHVNIVMQLGRYDLASFIDQVQYPLRQRQVKKIAYQVLNGLKILHQKEYIHRDLKPGNIIISKEGILKLCDFGSAVKCTKGEQYELEGFTRWYKAPEMLYGCRNYKYEVDVWSLGCILMEVATGQPYFDGKSQIEQLSLITRQLGNPTEKNWPSLTKLPDFGKITFKQMQEKTLEQIAEQRWISKELCAFIKKMIRYEGRSTVEELLNDPYLNEINQENSALTMPNQEQEKCSIEVKTSYQTLKKLVKDELKNC